MSEGRNIYLESYVKEEQKKFQRIAGIDVGNFITGCIHEIKPIRLGRYEDGS
jgi:hypothetical protein